MVEINFNNEGSIKQLIDNDKSKHSGYLIKDSKLQVIPAGKGIGWFSDSRGSLLYKEISGDFLIETEVEIFKKDGSKGLPKAQFSSAGLLIRNPSEVKGEATWMMYNIGFQNSFWGREIKVTRPNSSFRFDLTYLMGFQSLSTLHMIPAEYRGKKAKLRLGRINNEIRAYFINKNGEWEEEKPTANMESMGNGLNETVCGFNSEEFRPRSFGLNNRVQVGIISNPGMNTKNPLFRFRDSGANFTYLKISPIKSFDECLSR